MEQVATITQQSLCEMPVVFQAGSDNQPLPRPGWYASETRRAAAERLAPRVAQWAKEGNGESDLSHVTNAIEKAIESAFGLDGFDLAKELDDDGWECNAELVEILDDAHWAMSAAHDEAVKQWVRLYRIKPDLAVGATVTFETTHGKPAKNVTAKGVIYKIDEEKAQYWIRSEELGHVPEGQMGTQGTILNYEKVRACAVVSAVEQGSQPAES